MKSKTCSKCKTPRPITDFYKDRSQPTGHHYHCKFCKRDNNLRWSRENRNHVNQKQKESRERRPTAPERAREKQRLHWELRTENASANGKLRRAVRLGRIEKPDNCSACGDAMPTRALHGHHEDYAKPLEVEWLCYSCHGAKHQTAEYHRPIEAEKAGEE